jgi:hypothetical protein
MSGKAITSLVIIGCGISLALLSTFTPAKAPPNPAAEGNTEFGDGVMMVYLTMRQGLEARTEAQALSDAKLVKLGDRYFVRGKTIIFQGSQSHEKYKMLEGAEVGFAWENVTRFYLMPREVFEEHVAALTAEE